ncbi:hypothetical protein BWGOE3_28350 [Bacillus mycoides]|uniref:BC_2427 family protein n=1 Tax=Bacillus mycoides TaxID=1405 RepID=UPI000871D580|nr:hypothetical protein [Bacillus mycoides]OFD46505.1 hypothetical protein BWGOE3_28350 [Bacillus mycoides]OFD59158.1 hypothetical protein BWGOE6_28020 [Bacillus mycoides]
MNKPWIGKGIWNKIYKEEKLNIQDDSYEIRKKKGSLETESEKEDKGSEIEKECVETGSEEEDKESELEKEDVETGSEKEDKEFGLEKEDVETGSEKEDKEPGLEKEDVETGSEKEDKGSEIEKECVETGSEEEDKESELEKEDVETGSEKEDKEFGLEKEDVETGSEKEDKEPGLEKEDVETGSEKEDKESGLKKEDVETESEINTSVRFMVVKIPFSIISEVSRFLNYPNINVKKQETFVFQNEKEEGYRELDAKLLTTVQHYHGEAYCKLVSSNLHEKRVLLEFSNPKVKDDIKENRIETSSWIPIHSMILEKGSEGEFNDYITATLPIEIGRYEGEISLREKVIFKEKVIEIKEVSQEIILTKNEILLPKIKKTGQNPFTVEKGSLLVEGYIFQYIEYIIEQSTFHDNVYQLMQNIVLGLTVQVLQEQEVQVRIT